MSVEIPPAEEEQDGTETRSVDELLRELLVGEKRVKVDPTSGEVEAAPEESP
jgi:hypothetical protein